MEGKGLIISRSVSKFEGPTVFTYYVLLVLSTCTVSRGFSLGIVCTEKWEIERVSGNLRCPLTHLPTHPPSVRIHKGREKHYTGIFLLVGQVRP